MKYKVGDRVKIKSLDWYNRHTNGTEVDCGAYPFTSDMKEFCGQERIIANVCQECYLLLGIDDKFVFTDEMFEGLAEEEVGLVDMLSSRWVNEFNLLEGYIFKDENGNVINAKRIVLEKKKKEYPKTYEECKRVMGVGLWNTLWGEDATEYEEQTEDLIDALIRLKVCRDAYWKIAGEEMGLGKPWEYDCKSDYFAFAIIYRNGWIQKVGIQHKNAILAFPTEEMRDAFYENFKELIEECKELL